MAAACSNSSVGIIVGALLPYFMQISIYQDYEALSWHAADTIMEFVGQHPGAVLCLAAGDTPRLAYQLIAESAAEGKADFRRCTFVGLDEWVGIPPETEGSCHYFLRRHLFDPLQIPEDAIHLFDGLSDDLDYECKKMNEIISAKGGIDLMLVGVGINGHIGLNEPGVSPHLYAHVVELDSATQTMGQKYFKQQTPLTRGITLGLKHLLEARKVILIANGTRKAEIIRQALEGPVTPDLPASIIRMHRDSRVMLDEAAAAALTRRP